MKLINKLNMYLEDKDYKIIIKKNFVNVINIEEILDFSITEVTIKCKQNKIIIEGKKLIISKMQENEVLIQGTISNVSII